MMDTTITPTTADTSNILLKLRAASTPFAPVPPAPSPEEAARADLVARCSAFTSELKQLYPPGSLVFTLFVAFVKQGAKEVSHQNIQERKDTILQLIHLLKPNKRLLHMFYALLPPWVFVRPGNPPPGAVARATDDASDAPR
mmetsp:Transcript_18420/g.54735  ORF Transcript_18420/g.54735 Transcript_18420/m.54735 type:complete len:142 (-) Transcript_18420:90-515(-)